MKAGQHREMMFMSAAFKLFVLLPLLVCFLTEQKRSLCFQQRPFETLWQPTAVGRLDIQSTGTKTNVTLTEEKENILQKKISNANVFFLCSYAIMGTDEVLAVIEQSFTLHFYKYSTMASNLWLKLAFIFPFICIWSLLLNTNPIITIAKICLWI